MGEQIKVCPDCGHLNSFFEPFCVMCQRELATVDPIDEDDLLVAFNGLPRATIVLVNLTLDDRLPDGKEVCIPDDDGEFVIGRDSGSYVPDINLKDFSVPYISNDRNDPNFNLRQRGISRSHAVLLRVDNELFVYRHPDATVTLPVKLDGTEVIVTDASQAVPVLDGSVIELGEIFVPGSRQRAPGVIFAIKYA